MTLKLKVKRTIVKDDVIAAPDYYDFDDSPLGRLVDYLLRNDECEGMSCRTQMHHFTEAGDVEHAVNKLDRAYEEARAIAAILGVQV
jgi:hypothetical protein